MTIKAIGNTEIRVEPSIYQSANNHCTFTDHASFIVFSARQLVLDQSLNSDHMYSIMPTPVIQSEWWPVHWVFEYMYVSLPPVILMASALNCKPSAWTVTVICPLPNHQHEAECPWWITPEALTSPKLWLISFNTKIRKVYFSVIRWPP